MDSKPPKPKVGIKHTNSDFGFSQSENPELNTTLLDHYFYLFQIVSGVSTLTKHIPQHVVFHFGT
jgi:hypothetical protein